MALLLEQAEVMADIDGGERGFKRVLVYFHFSGENFQERSRAKGYRRSQGEQA
ncbi:MAG: hypothetical protein IT291_08895 [Deltaproteobacteria bacterium]|nr:hypothetical protein [Deltaproteobacteria bacterium]